MAKTIIHVVKPHGGMLDRPPGRYILMALQNDSDALKMAARLNEQRLVPHCNEYIVEDGDH